MEELQQIPEVKEIYTTERTAAIIEYHDEQLEIPIIPITPDNQEEILKTLPVRLDIRNIGETRRYGYIGDKRTERSPSYLPVNRRKSDITMVRWN